MYLADYHTHSSVSPDGSVTVIGAGGAAIDRGLDEICVTDHVDTVLWGSHAPRTISTGPPWRGRWPEARQRCGDRLTIRMGAELGEAPMASTGRKSCWPMRRSWTSSSGRYTWPEKNFTILTYITLKKGRNVLS